MLREEAARPGIPKDRAASATSLAEYFERLAADPYTDAADIRFV